VRFSRRVAELFLPQMPFRVLVSHVEAKMLVGLPVEEKGSSEWDLFVTCQIFADGEALVLPEATCHRPLIGRPTWNEWLTLPITVDALPVSSVAVFTVWDCGASGVPVAIGGTTIPLFGENSKMRKGRKKLFLWLGRSGDGLEGQSPFDAAVPDESDRLNRCLARYEKQRYTRIGWLDAQSFAEIRARQAKQTLSDNVAFLHVEFPVFLHPVLYHEKEFVTPVDESETNSIAQVYDPEMSQSNPIDERFQRMRRVQIGLDANLKLTTAEKRDLARIVEFPTTKRLTEEEKNKVWMSRIYLKTLVAALPKFLQSVDWSLDSHAAEAIKLMREGWAPLNVEVALELLTSQFTASNERIRDQAVWAIRGHVQSFLDSLPDEALVTFLLQLVQAMRPERAAAQRPLSDFLMKRARRSKVFGSHFFWYMKVEAESEDDDGAWYKSMIVEFLETLKTADESLFNVCRRQDLLVRTLKELYRHIQEQSKNNRLEMIAIMQKELVSGKFAQLKSFAPLPFPLNPLVEVKGLIAEKCSVFKSAQKPLGLCFEKTDGSPYFVLFKVGDDLRCDQLVLQIISLMDAMLKRDGNLDLSLSPYRVLATGRNDGMVEIVGDSISVAACLKSHDNDIAAFFRKLHPSDSGPYGTDAKVLENFVRSCAGYGVITYILGVGDRHLDNLLLQSNGKLFHIDFGFILGEDPKSWPPPMKITREMVMAMGGDASEHYYKVRSSGCFLTCVLTFC
jgi:phosphatidylinositol 3-kinase